MGLSESLYARLLANSNTDADTHGSLVRSSSIPSCLAYQHVDRLWLADRHLGMLSGCCRVACLGSLGLLSHAAAVFGMWL